MIRAGGDRAVDLLALAVVVSVAIAAGPVTWRLLGRDGGRRAAAALVSRSPEPAVDLASLRQLAPFGTRVVAGGVPGDPTALGLQLRGVMLARPAASSIALIAAAGGPAKGFAVGETLPGGAILDSVEYDLVVLRVGGQLVTLALPVKTGAAAVPATAGPIPVAGPSGPIEVYRARAQDPASLLGSLGATATADGYRVGPSPSDDLRRAGLQPGDVVTKVDGQAVGDPARDRALFDAAVVAGRMRVEIVRDGKHIALSFPLR